MAEAGWHPKREARRFEPPPWEREQFEALERRKPEQPAPERADDAPGPGAAVTAGPQVPAAREELTAVPAGGPPAPRPSAVADAQVDEMLMRLKAEEPDVQTHGRGVSVFSAALMMFMGVCMLAWGGIAGVLAKGRIEGAIGSMIVFVMGGLFAGAGLWLGLRVTRRED